MVRFVVRALGILLQANEWEVAFEQTGICRVQSLGICTVTSSLAMRGRPSSKARVQSLRRWATCGLRRVRLTWILSCPCSWHLGQESFMMHKLPLRVPLQLARRPQRHPHSLGPFSRVGHCPARPSYRKVCSDVSVAPATTRPNVMMLRARILAHKTEPSLKRFVTFRRGPEPPSENGHETRDTNMAVFRSARHKFASACKS